MKSDEAFELSKQITKLQIEFEREYSALIMKEVTLENLKDKYYTWLQTEIEKARK
jgi:hypothetical protein